MLLGGIYRYQIERGDRGVTSDFASYLNNRIF